MPIKLAFPSIHSQRSILCPRFDTWLSENVLSCCLNSLPIIWIWQMEHESLTNTKKEIRIKTDVMHTTDLTLPYLLRLDLVAFLPSWVLFLKTRASSHLPTCRDRSVLTRRLNGTEWKYSIVPGYPDLRDRPPKYLSLESFVKIIISFSITR